MLTVRVLTWNLWWRFGDWRARRAAIASVLADVQPDICCFQEVWATEATDLAGMLGQEIGLPHVVLSRSNAPERWNRRIGTTGLDIGNAIVSRWPIDSTRSLDLPGVGGRTALTGLILSPHGPIPVLCTHLTAEPEASGERCEHARAIVQLVADIGRQQFPPIIAGDMNAEPDSDEMRLLSGTLTAPALEGMWFLDAWRYAADDDPGWTWRRENPNIVFGTNARIDHLFLGAPGPGGIGLPTEVRLCGDGPRDGIWPSDHAAIVADLIIAI